MTDAWLPLTRELDRWAAAGRRADFWLRDDDAIEPTPALDRMLALTAGHAVPLALAVVPEPTDARLTRRLDTSPEVTVVQHGWQHANHAPPSEKKQEFGAHRPLRDMLAEAAEGRRKLAALHDPRFFPMFVPPWNRIAPEVAAELPAIGFALLSTFGDKPLPGIASVNSTVDVMDWRGTRGGRAQQELLDDIAMGLRRIFEEKQGAIGLLTHHLVHDETVWAFLDRLFAATARHPGCRWVAVRDLAAGRDIAPDVGPDIAP